MIKSYNEYEYTIQLSKVDEYTVQLLQPLDKNHYFSSMIWVSVTRKPSQSDSLAPWMILRHFYAEIVEEYQKEARR